MIKTLPTHCPNDIKYIDDELYFIQWFSSSRSNSMLFASFYREEVKERWKEKNETCNQFVVTIVNIDHGSDGGSNKKKERNVS